MRIRTRVIFLLVLLSVIFAAGRYFYQVFEDRRMFVLFKESTEDSKANLDNLLRLKGANLEVLAFDYTYWDEMLNFAVSPRPDIAWAQANMDENVLKTYEADAIWVFKLDLSLAHQVKSEIAAPLEGFVIPKEEIKEIFLKERFCHFFIKTSAGLMEIRGATIHPSVDAERTTPPRGYFFTGRIWSKQYVDEFGKLVDGQAKITFVKQTIPPLRVLAEDSSIVYAKELIGRKNEPAAYFYATITSRELKSYKMYSRNSEIIFMVFLVSVIIFIAVFLRGALNKPFAIITRTLKTEDPEDLCILEKDNSEFGDIARLISRFFKQKEALIKEISERKKLEEELKKKMETLEWFYKLTVGRELKMVELKKRIEDLEEKIKKPPPDPEGGPR